jgi:hypothetical protein
MGNCMAAANPAKTMMIEMTDEKIGLVMKNELPIDVRLCFLVSGGGRAGRP